jgi:hypothetical protein
MLSSEDRRRIYERAYLPEQLPDYVVGVSGADPCLLMDHVLYLSASVLILVGYPLEGPFQEERLRLCLDAALKRFHPRQLTLIAPLIPPWRLSEKREEGDAYYRLDLRTLKRDTKLRNTLKRASRDLSCEKGNKLSEEHRGLISDFTKRADVEEDYTFIFSRIDEYLGASPSAIVFSGRKRSGALSAFTIADYGAKECGFYMFNFRSTKNHVPGASDLLLDEAIRAASDQGKPFMNLGLGINAGVRCFKAKWGAEPFLPYQSATYRFSRSSLSDFFLKRIPLR